MEDLFAHLPPDPSPREPDNPGVVCPRCHCRHCPAEFTRRLGTRTIRQRRCRACGHAFRCSERVLEAGSDSFFEERA